MADEMKQTIFDTFKITAGSVLSDEKIAQVESLHRVYFNKPFKCISSNILILSRKRAKNADDNEAEIIEILDSMIPDFLTAVSTQTKTEATVKSYFINFKVDPTLLPKYELIGKTKKTAKSKKGKGKVEAADADEEMK